MDLNTLARGPLFRRHDVTASGGGESSNAKSLDASRFTAKRSLQFQFGAPQAPHSHWPKQFHETGYQL